MARRNIVVIGTSVGGVEALQKLVRSLPQDLAASVFIVLHLAPESPSLLPEILERAGQLPAVHPRDGDRIREGQIYVAPPNHHMLLEQGRVRIVHGPKENRHRPAIDPLFRSAALAYGPRVIGVVLTGSLDDGTAGIISVKRRGGLAIIQDPSDAFCPDMPKSALRHLREADYVLSIEQLGHKLAKLIKEPVRAEKSGGEESLQDEIGAAEMDPAIVHDNEHPGKPSAFACPECNGVLWEKQEGDLLHFRCRVGHAYTANSLAAEQSLAVENALWAALRALEENASLNDRLAERSRDRRQMALSDRFRERALSKRHEAEVLRDLLLAGQKPEQAEVT